MRIVIIGQKWLAAELLKQCLADGHAVIQALAPRPCGPEPDRLWAAAKQAGIPASHTDRTVTGADIPAGCDVILAAHAHAYIDASARASARHGALGYHPSLLPRHRGRDAVRWTLHMREPIAGGTLYWMDDGADTGPIALQAWCHVRPGDTPSELWRRDLAPIGLRLFREALPMLETGSLPAVGQSPDLATWEPAFNNRPLGRVRV